MTERNASSANFNCITNIFQFGGSYKLCILITETKMCIYWPESKELCNKLCMALPCVSQQSSHIPQCQIALETEK